MKIDLYLKPNLVTYNTVLIVHAKAGNCCPAQDIVEFMQEEVDRKPDQHAYSGLIQASLRSKQAYCGVAEIEKVFEEMGGTIFAVDEFVANIFTCDGCLCEKRSKRR